MNCLIFCCTYSTDFLGFFSKGRDVGALFRGTKIEKLSFYKIKLKEHFLPMKHIIKLVQDIRTRCSYASKLPFTNNLKSRLQCLTCLEKNLIADSIYKLEYDIGTGRMLGLLEQLGIISVQFYITRIEDTPLLMNIYNDFLENQPSLFAELVEGATQKFNPNSVQLEETLGDFLQDFVQHLDGLQSNPFKAIVDQLNLEAKNYLNEALLVSFLKNGSVSIQKALKEQHLWEEENTDPIKNQIIKDCLMEPESIISCIHRFVLSTSKSEINWRVYCQLLRSLARMYGSKIYSFYRRLLSDDFKQFVRDKNEFLLYLIMVTIRQLSLSSPQCFKYKEWYKINIGEIMYTIDKGEFQYVMKVLTKLTEHERNKDFLNVHINTRIQAPPLCSEAVYTFKAILRSRLETLGKEKKIIVIDL